MINCTMLPLKVDAGWTFTVEGKTKETNKFHRGHMNIRLQDRMVDEDLIVNEVHAMEDFITQEEQHERDVDQLIDEKRKQYA